MQALEKGVWYLQGESGKKIMKGGKVTVCLFGHLVVIRSYGERRGKNEIFTQQCPATTSYNTSNALYYKSSNK